MSRTSSSVPTPLLALLLLLPLLTSRILGAKPRSIDDVDDEAEGDDDEDAVGGDDDSDVELEQAEATSDEPFDEFPLELAAQLTKLATVSAEAIQLLLQLSTTSVSCSIRWRLITGWPLLIRLDDEADDEDDDDDDVVEGVDIMATSVTTTFEDVLDPLPLSVTSGTDDGGGGPGGGGGSKGPRPFFGSFSFWRTMECCFVMWNDEYTLRGRVLTL